MASEGGVSAPTALAASRAAGAAGTRGAGTRGVGTTRAAGGGAGCARRGLRTALAARLLSVGTRRPDWRNASSAARAGDIGLAADSAGSETVFTSDTGAAL